MESKKVQEIRALVQSEELAAWYDLYRSLHGQIEEVHAGYADAITHAIFRAGELEEASAEAHARYVELETSFEALSDYEMQRQRTTASWIELNRAEKYLEDLRAEAAELRARLEARAKGRRLTSGVTEAQRREEDLGRLDAEIARLSRDVDHRRQQFEENAALRDRLWEQVEGEWSQAFLSNMARAEYAYLARRVRARADALTATGGATAGQAERPGLDATSSDDQLDAQLRGLEGKLSEVLEQGRQAFGCALVREFLYWPHGDDALGALCVPLVDERDHLNVQVTALHIYRIERARGIEFIEPVAREAETPEDPRLDAFFA